MINELLDIENFDVCGPLDFKTSRDMEYFVIFVNETITIWIHIFKVKI